MADGNFAKTISEALNRIVEEGIAGAKRDYKRPDQKDKLNGSILGFMECRGKTPTEIITLHVLAIGRAQDAFNEQADDYWYWRCRVVEIEWVMNVLSHILVAQGIEPITHMMTAQGGLQAARIIGVAEHA